MKNSKFPRKSGSSTPLELHLQTVQSDVVDVTPQNNPISRSLEITVGASRIPASTFPASREDVRNDRGYTPRLYREHKQRFRSETVDSPPGDVCRPHPSVGKDPIRRLAPIGLPKDTVLAFAYNVQLYLGKMTVFLLGLLAGLALANTLASFITFPDIFTEITSLSIDFAVYASVNQIIQIAFFIVLAIIGINVLDRCDIARSSRSCCQGDCDIVNRGILMPSYFITFGVHNALYWFNGVLTVANVAQQIREPNTLFAGSSDIIWLRVWQILDVIRTTGILLCWLIYAASARRSDAFLKRLLNSACAPDKTAKAGIQSKPGKF